MSDQTLNPDLPESTNGDMDSSTKSHKPRPGPKVGTRKAPRWAGKQAEFRALLPVYGPQGKPALAKAMGISLRSLDRLQQETGLYVSDVRQAARAAAVEELVADGPGPLDWTILQLFDELCPFFRQPAPGEDPDQVFATWTAWRVFLAAAFGLPAEQLQFCQAEKLTRNRLPDYPGTPSAQAQGISRGAAALTTPGLTPEEIFKVCTGRSTWPTSQARTAAMIVGRRGGKSYIAAVIGIYLASCRKYGLNLGDQPMVMILAKDKKQARVIRRYIVSFLQAHPRLSALLTKAPTQEEIELVNGMHIEIKAVSDTTTRGFKAVAVLCDEIAFWPTDESAANQDREVIRALGPTMMDVKGAMIVMLSSPYARRGVLFETYKKSFGKDDDKRTLVWQADTLSMRPTDDEDVLEEIRSKYAEDAESAKSEYGALFRSDLESYVSRTILEARCADGIGERPFQAKFNYVVFVDPSGGQGDSYALAVAHHELRKFGDVEDIIPVLDLAKEWPAPFNTEEVSGEVAEICRRYHQARVVGDAYAGEWPREPLRKRGIRYEISEKNRSVIYQEFLPKLNGNRVELLDANAHPRLINQLANLERRTGRTGRDVIDHPVGQHDDLANAVAGALVQPPPPVAFTGTLDIGIPRDVPNPSWRR